jgi:hypothetical protein
MMNKVDLHFDICKALNKIYEQKNHDYGDSFHETWKEEGFAMARIRLSDKLNRFKKLSKIIEVDNEDQMVKDESMQDTLLDLANYAIMTVMEMRIETDERKKCGGVTCEEACEGVGKLTEILNKPYAGGSDLEVRL